MTGDQVRVVTAGETMMLVAPTGPGRLRHAGALNASSGGAESNVAIGLSRLGVRSRWLGAVGRDEPGQLVLHRIRAEGVDTSAVIEDPDRPTALYLREQVAGVTRVYYYRAGSAGSALAPGCLDAAVLAGADVLHLSGITAALSESCAGFVDWLIDLAREAGLLISYDVNYRSRLWTPERARAATEAVLDRVDLLLVGHDEARALWGWDDETALDRLSRRGPAETVLKRGRHGCAAVIDGVRLDEPGFVVTEIDPIGAGDAFAAGYLAARLQGRPPSERLRTANAMGAFCVQSHGDYEGLPSAAELEAFTEQREDLGEMIMEPSDLLSGIYVANVSPMHDDERCSLNVEAYLAHVGWLAGHGVRGVVPFGTNGEGPVIATAEKREVLSRLFELDLPAGFQLVPTVAEGNLPDTLDQLAFLAGAPVTAVLVLPPFYFKPLPTEGLELFYRRVLAATDHPVIAYHIPKYAVPVPAELVGALPFWGVKDSDGSPGYAEAVHAAGRGVLLGTEDDVPGGLRIATGAITALANVVPDQLVALYDHVRAGREDEAAALSAHLRTVRAMTKQHTSVAVLKRLAGERQGLDLGTARPPQLPLPADYDAAAALATALAVG